MWSITVNSQPLDLPDKLSITLNRKNPLFNTEGDYSFPFKIPYTLNNARILSFINRIEANNDQYQVFSGELKWDGILYFSGSLKVKNANNDSFELILYSNEGDLNFKIKNLNLKQIDFGDLEFDDKTDALIYMALAQDKYYPDRPCCFPQIQNKEYFDPPTEDEDQMFFNRYVNGIIYETTPLGNKNLIVPMLFVRYVFEKIFDQLGYFLEDSLFTSDADFNKLALFNSLCANDILDEFTYSFEHIYFNLHVPDVTLGDFFKAVSSFFNSYYFVNNKSKTVKLIPAKDILSDTQIIDFSKNVLSINFEAEDQIIGYTLSLSMDGGDKSFETLSQNEENDLKSLKGAVKSVSDLPEFPIAEIGEYRYVIDIDMTKGMSPQKIWIDGIVFNRIVFSKFLYLYAKSEISIGMSSLYSANFDEFACVCSNTFADYKDIGIRMFYAAYNSIDHPHYMYAKNRTTNNGMFFNQPNNSFMKYWKDWIYFRMKSKPVKIIRQMSFLELSTFDFSKKYRINGINYLISEIQVSINGDQIMPATIKAYTCY